MKWGGWVGGGFDKKTGNEGSITKPETTVFFVFMGGIYIYICLYMPKHDKIDKLKDPRSFPAPYPSIWTILCGKLKEIATRTG